MFNGQNTEQSNAGADFFCFERSQKLSNTY